MSTDNGFTSMKNADQPRDNVDGRFFQEGIEDKARLEIVMAQLPRGGSRVKSVDPYKAVLRDWENFTEQSQGAGDPNSTGTFINLTTHLTNVVERELTGKKLSNGPDVLSRLRENIETMRKDGRLGPQDGDTKDELAVKKILREVGLAFTVVEIHTEDPKIEGAKIKHPQVKSEDLVAQSELPRLSSRKDGYKDGRAPEGAERSLLHTIVFENLSLIFPIGRSSDKPWAQWTEVDKKKAATKLGIDSEDLERLHRRLLVASIFANKDEIGRRYFQPSNRAVFNESILDNWCDELNIPRQVNLNIDHDINPPGPWTPADGRRIAMNYEVTEQEASDMRREVWKIVTNRKN